MQVRNRAPAVVSLEDGLAAVAIGVAAELSAKQGRVVTIAEVLEANNSGATGAETEPSKARKESEGGTGGNGAAKRQKA